MNESEIGQCELKYIFDLLEVHKKHINTAEDNSQSDKKKDEKEVYIDNLVF